MTNSADPDQLANDLDLHCLLRQGMSCSAREGLNNVADIFFFFFFWFEVLRPNQPNGVMSSAVSLSNHTFTGQA